MSNIKAPNIKKKLTGTIEPPSCTQIPHVSFRYLTSNSSYNFNYFSNKNNALEAKAELYDRIESITKDTWLHWNGLPKDRGGIETINSGQIKWSPNGYSLTNDQKLIIFRFNSNNYRIIGFKDGQCPTFYIIGFDFNYSAYNHGH